MSGGDRKWNRQFAEKNGRRTGMILAPDVNSFSFSSDGRFPPQPGIRARAALPFFFSISERVVFILFFSLLSFLFSLRLKGVEWRRKWTYRILFLYLFLSPGACARTICSTFRWNHSFSSSVRPWINAVHTHALLRQLRVDACDATRALHAHMIRTRYSLAGKLQSF